MKKLALLFLALLLFIPASLAVSEEIHEGRGQGRNGDIVVSVTTADGRIRQVQIVAHEETPGIADPALESIPKAIAASNSTAVDAVAGATLTSQGIMDAVADALGESLRKKPKDGKDWSAYEPKVTVLENGVRVQKTPDAYAREGWFFDQDWHYYNTYYMDADHRGCSSCHALDDMLKQFDHVVYQGAYEAEDMPFQNCIACHSYSYSGERLKEPIHARHLGNASFTSMGGTCQSCHYIDDEGNYLRWDFVKYDVMRGMTDLDADNINMTVEWNQEEVTPTDKVFTNWWGAPGFVFTRGDLNFSYDYVADLAPSSDTIRDEYVLSVYGLVENPIQMTINEMIEQFGSETRLLCGHCTINGTGGSLIYQCQVTGIPIAAVLSYVSPQADGTVFMPFGMDNYAMPITTAHAQEYDGLLVYEINGEPLRPEHGYPIAFMCGTLTAGNFVRNLTEIYIGNEEEMVYETHGSYVDDTTGFAINKPNIGVLTAESGQIFPAGETVHLEGYAHAFSEPITALEFSMDHGQTWRRIETEGTDAARWVYWKMDLGDLTPGAYLLKLRATSLDADGGTHTNEEYPSFLINVK